MLDRMPGPIIAPLLAALLVGCSTVAGSGNSFALSFPARPNLDSLPVVVNDHTSLIRGVELASDAQLPPDAVAAVPGMPTGLLIQWMGGMCDERVAIDVRGDDKLTFAIETTTEGGMCFLAGIPRGLVVTFSVPVDPADVAVEYPE